MLVSWMDQKTTTSASPAGRAAFLPAPAPLAGHAPLTSPEKDRFEDDAFTLMAFVHALL